MDKKMDYSVKGKDGKEVIIESNAKNESSKKRLATISEMIESKKNQK